MTEVTNGPDEETAEPPTTRERSLSREGETLYALLNLNKDADDADIKKAYRKMALRHHPDKNPGDPTATDRFKEINRAHTVLSNPTKRRIYDKYGSVGLETADQVGDEMAELLLKIDTWWCKGLFCFCGIITVCYFGCCCLCCCCNCCCGKCKHDHEDEDFKMPEDDDEEPITKQPTSSGAPVVLGAPPPSGGSAPIVLGAPAPSSGSAPIVLGAPPPASDDPPPAESTNEDKTSPASEKEAEATQN